MQVSKTLHETKIQVKPTIFLNLNLKPTIFLNLNLFILIGG